MPITLTIPEHLSPEDAQLYVDLYRERNRVPRHEIRIVRGNAWQAAADQEARGLPGVA